MPCVRLSAITGVIERMWVLDCVLDRLHRSL
jgi:hypothetical protein